MLSKKCKYAIHALVFMGRNPEQKYLIKDISSSCRIPKKFLEGILLDLKRAGMLGSKQGKDGGYFFRKSIRDINLAEVVRLFDGAIAALPCATYKYYEPCKECVHEEQCSIREAFLAIRNATVDLLKSDTILGLVQREYELVKTSRGKKRPTR
jgi:Rrf2 family protein